MLKHNQAFTKYINILHTAFAADAHLVEGQ
jgi:hypothetical protein